MSWQEPIDQGPGRPPLIRPDGASITFELRVSGGLLRDGLFVPTPRTRLLIRCHRDGEITLQILETRTAAEEPDHG